MMLQGRADQPVDGAGGGVGRAGASTPYSTTGHLVHGRTEHDDKGKSLLPQSFQHTLHTLYDRRFKPSTNLTGATDLPSSTMRVQGIRNMIQGLGTSGT